MCQNMGVQWHPRRHPQARQARQVPVSISHRRAWHLILWWLVNCSNRRIVRQLHIVNCGRICWCWFGTVFLGYLRIVLRPHCMRLWKGHGQNGAKAGQEDNCNGLFVEKSERGINISSKRNMQLGICIIETYKKLHNVRCYFK